MDVESIKDDWLTDSAICFWEEWLEHEKLPQFPKAHIVLLRPTMSLMLVAETDVAMLKQNLPDFSHTTHIFLPVNDNTNFEDAEGGSHWSLLLVSAIDGVAFHYDSMIPSNDMPARRVKQNFERILNKPLRFVAMDDSPQQENSSDCGVYVCLLMRTLLLNRLLKADSKERVSMSMGHKDVNAKRGRREMLDLIEGFRKEGERRRS